MLKEQIGVTQAEEVWLALTVEGAPKAFHTAGCSHNALIGLRQ